ncbi:hypothetical protein GCM10009557_37580 [Virgisporangium ochraceum]|uniref:Uncharacterized protein n=1 Tax=Virgisporangium ochraceum TaxID=65505 RepID=A0A8J4EGL4_9ACTN|nr:hypothetical protein [Virgisporangium ochraceum]GIJ74905.1 hypothetical protein Voc01_098220 [Virgisporangium ochraceum]
MTAVLGTVAMAVVAAVLPVSPAAAAETCTTTWRTLQFGDSGRHAVVEPGAPWHVRLGTATNGYHLFLFCVQTSTSGKTRIRFDSNANGNLTAERGPSGQIVRRIHAAGFEPGWDTWYVCALDAKWVEISFTPNDYFLGVNSSGYLDIEDDHPNGNALWRRSEFDGIDLVAC